MKKTLMKRILPLLLTVVMLFSVTVPSFALGITAPTEDEPYYSIVLEDGVLTVRLNPDKVYEVLRDRELTKEELTKFIPEDVLNTLTDDEGDTLSDLAYIASNYITADDIIALKEMIPADVLREYFDLAMLEDIITLDELLEVVPVDEILKDVTDDDLKIIINAEVLELLLTESVKENVLTDEFIEALLRDGEVIEQLVKDPVIRERLIDLIDGDLVDKVFSDAEIKEKIIAITESEETLNAVLNDKECMDAIKAFFQAHHERVNGFVYDPDVIVRLRNDDMIIDFLDEHVNVEDAINPDEMDIDKLLADELYNFTPENFRYYVINHPEWDLGITEQDIIDNDGDFEKILRNTNINLRSFCRVYGITFENLIKRGHLTDAQVAKMISDNWDDAVGDDSLAKEIITVVGLHKVFEHFDRDELVKVMGGYAELISKGILNEDKIIETIGGYAKLVSFMLPEKLQALIDAITLEKLAEFINFRDIIDTAGGYTAVIKWYSFGEISDILDAIDRDDLEDFLDESGIKDNVDIKQILTDLLDLLRSKKPQLKALAKDIAKRASRFMTNEVSTITLNGDAVIYKNGTFDLQQIVTTSLQAIPDVEDFLAMESGDTFTQLIFSTNIRGKDYSYGFAVEFIGDLTRLQNLAAAHADKFVFDVSDDLDITTSVVVPAVASELYERALLSEKIPAEIKGRILQAPTMTVGEMSLVLAGLSDDQLESYAAEVMEKIDSIKEKIYAKLEAKLGADNEALEAAKAEVDELLALVSDGENLGKLRDKGVAALDKAEAYAPDMTVADFYAGKGAFNVKRSFSFDVFALINKVVTVSDNLLVLFGNDMTVTGTVDATVTFNGIYKATVVTADGETLEYFLPEGIRMDILNSILGIGADFGDDKMPATDSSFVDKNVCVIEFYDEDGNLIESTTYLKGETPKAPAVPEKFGYDGAWEDYVLGSSQLIQVRPVYTAKTYNVTFLADGALVTRVPYKYGETALANVPAVPVKAGFTGVWEAYTLGSSDITVNAIYSANTNKVVFKADGVVVDTVEFKTGDTTLSRIPAVPVKAGYTGAWEPIVLGTSDYVVNAVYTANTYKVTFVANGKVVDTVEFTTGDTTLSRVPTVPAKNGYSGRWEAYTLGTEDIIVNATYAPQNLKATFVADGKVIATVPFAAGDSTLSSVPAVPTKTGHTGAWENIVLGSADVTINAVYTANTYKVTFVADGNVIGTVDFIYGNTALTSVPTVPAKTGFTGIWENYVLGASDITVNAVYTANTYKVVFKADGKEIASVNYKTGDTVLQNVPTVPAKVGYTAAWESFTLGTADITVNAVYTENTYKVIFIAGNQIVKELTYTVNDKELKDVPAVPAKAGYTAAWEQYTLGTHDVVVNAVYVPVVYTATFTVDGTTLATVKFTVEDKALVGAPAVPAKAGYTGAWSTYTIGAGDLTINAEYTLITYNAYFTVDGEVIATVPFTVNDTAITAPEVPAKEGYTGVWEEYELGAANVNVNAKYTKIPAPLSEPAPDLTFIVWIVLALLVIAAVVVIIIVLRKKDPEEPDNTPKQKMIVPESVEENAEPDPVIEIVEDVDVETADELMTDTQAAHMVKVVKGAGVGGLKSIININQLNDAFSAGDEVTLEKLKELKLVPAATVRLKVLADGHLNKPLKVYSEQFSVQAVKMIVLTGGEATQLK